MITSNNSFGQNDDCGCSHTKYYLNNLSYEQDPVQIFLNDEAFFGKSQQNKQSESCCDFSNTHDGCLQASPEEIKETHQSAKAKSIFHNFQKHLITLIKKFINVGWKEEDCNQGDRLAWSLWTAFMKTRSFNKKILHMLFGVLEKNNIGDQFSRLSEQFPEFKPIYSKFSISDILEAQRFMRQKFVQHACRLNKAELKADCGVNRFQEFYEYYQSFIREVRAGPITKRMTKCRKFGVVERLAEKAVIS